MHVRTIFRTKYAGCQTRIMQQRNESNQNFDLKHKSQTRICLIRKNLLCWHTDRKTDMHTQWML